MAAFKVEDFVTWKEDDIKDRFLHLTKDQYFDIISHYKAKMVCNAPKDVAQRKALSVFKKQGLLVDFELPKTREELELESREQDRLNKLKMLTLELEMKKLRHIQVDAQKPSSDKSNVGKCVASLPKFKETDLEELNENEINASTTKSGARQVYCEIKENNGNKKPNSNKRKDGKNNKHCKYCRQNNHTILLKIV